MNGSIPLNDSPSNTNFKSNPECPRCRYAVYALTGRCSNDQCPKHERDGKALTAEQLHREYTPRLFHGRHWGDWVLDTERLTLVFRGEPAETGVPTYTAFFSSWYELDLEWIKTSAGVLDWIFQINGKGWATARVMKDLINALDDIFHPQRNLCSGGGHRVIKNPGAFLRDRIATVGTPREAAE